MESKVIAFREMFAIFLITDMFLLGLGALMISIRDLEIFGFLFIAASILALFVFITYTQISLLVRMEERLAAIQDSLNQP